MPLRVRFDKVDGFIRNYDGTKYLVLHGFETYKAINDKIRYFIGLFVGITYFFSYNYAKFKDYSDGESPFRRNIEFA